MATCAVIFDQLVIFISCSCSLSSGGCTQLFLFPAGERIPQSHLALSAIKAGQPQAPEFLQPWMQQHPFSWWPGWGHVTRPFSSCRRDVTCSMCAMSPGKGFVPSSERGDPDVGVQIPEMGDFYRWSRFHTMLLSALVSRV